jgi:hypothetical protein
MAWFRGVERNGEAPRDDVTFVLMGKSSRDGSKSCCRIQTPPEVIDSIGFGFVMTKKYAFGRIKTAVLPLPDERLGHPRLFYPIPS